MSGELDACFREAAAQDSSFRPPSEKKYIRFYNEVSSNLALDYKASQKF